MFREFWQCHSEKGKNITSNISYKEAPIQYFIMFLEKTIFFHKKSKSHDAEMEVNVIFVFESWPTVVQKKSERKMIKVSYFLLYVL